jgi:hypothetical protein
MKSKYLTGIKQCFIDLGDPKNTSELYSQRQQADKLIEGRKNTHAAVESAKLICSDK